MMGTEVLRPQDCLTDRIRFNPASCSRRRNYGNYYVNNSFNSNNSHNRLNRKPVVRYEKPEQRRHQRAQSEPSISRRSGADDRTVRRSSVDDLRSLRSYDNNSVNSHDLVMEKVTILRRGESLDSKIKSGGEGGRKEGVNLVVTGKVGLGPAPEMVPKQIRIVDLKSPMAGKSDVYAGSAFAVSPAPSSLPLPSFSKKKPISIDDSATRDIKRLLRLEL